MMEINDPTSARRVAIRVLAQATPGTEEGQADAAFALMVLWAASKDEAAYLDAIASALAITDADLDELPALALDGAWAESARWLLG